MNDATGGQALELVIEGWVEGSWSVEGDTVRLEWRNGDDTLAVRLHALNAAQLRDDLNAALNTLYAVRLKEDTDE
jgi:hypothetical protein